MLSTNHHSPSINLRPFECKKEQSRFNIHIHTRFNQFWFNYIHGLRIQHSLRVAESLPTSLTSEVGPMLTTPSDEWTSSFSHLCSYWIHRSAAAASRPRLVFGVRLTPSILRCDPHMCIQGQGSEASSPPPESGLPWPSPPAELWKNVEKEGSSRRQSGCPA